MYQEHNLKEDRKSLRAGNLSKKKTLQVGETFRDYGFM